MVSTKELKNIAKERKLKNYHNLSKEDLSRMLKIPIFLTKRYYQNIAKDRNLKNYHHLKKADLVKLLNMNPEIPKKPIPAPRKKVISEKPIPAPRKKVISEKPIPAPRVILNITNPEINVPEIAVVKEKETPTVIKKAIETILGWMDWLKESGKKITRPISSALKNLKEKINTLFEEKFVVRDGQSSLNQFTREKIIDGKPGYDPKTFFQKTRNILIKIFKENKNTKTKMIFVCQMQRTDLKTGETIEVDADFHSDIEINIAEKDETKLLDKMIARIEEVLANFQQSGSNWVFQQIRRLEIHFANWKPIRGSTFIPLPTRLQNKKGVINIKNEDNQCLNGVSRGP